MTIAEKVFAVLGAAGGVTALVPADRIKPPGLWQNVAAPWIRHRPVAQQALSTHEGLETLTIWDPYEIAIFSTGYLQGEAIALAVRAALGNLRSDGFVSQFQSGPWHLTTDLETGLEHFVLHFRISQNI